MAARLHFGFLDTDEQIEAQTGLRISEIFQLQGEARFREYEREFVASLQDCRRTVISAGGGLITHSSNLAALQAHALVVCLWASAEAIWERVRHQAHRPLLQTQDPLATIRRLLAAREPYYRRADALIQTEHRSVKRVAAQVIHHFYQAQSPGSPS